MHNSLIIAKSEVPQYLQYGLLFESRRRDFVVPSNCLKPDLSIESDEDLRHLLDSVQFWKVYRMPEEVFTYVEANIDVRLLDHWSREVPKFKMCIRATVAANLTAPDKTLILVSALRTGQNFWKESHEQLGLPLAPSCWNLVAVLDDAPSATFLQLKGVSVNISTFVMSASLSVSLKCLKYAHSQDWEISDQAVLHAAEEGHQEVLQFLHQTCGIELTLETMVCTARFGKLDMMRYLHESGCPWDEEVCSAAAQAGHLRCLEYAHQQGCPWDEYTVLYAKSNNRVDCLEYALENGCPIFLTDDIFFRRYLKFTCCVSMVVLVGTVNKLYNMLLRDVIALAKQVRYLRKRLSSVGVSKYAWVMMQSPLCVYTCICGLLVGVYIGCIAISFVFLKQNRSSVDNFIRCLPEAMIVLTVLLTVMHQNFWRIQS